MGEVVQPRYVLPLLTLVVGVVSVGPRLGRPLPMPRVPGVLVAVALSISAVLAFWAYAHRFFAGTTVGLFDPKVDPAWTNGVGIPAWLVVLATAAASVALVWGTVWLSRSPEPTRSPDGSSTTAQSA